MIKADAVMKAGQVAALMLVLVSATRAQEGPLVLCYPDGAYVISVDLMRNSARRIETANFTLTVALAGASKTAVGGRIRVARSPMRPMTPAGVAAPSPPSVQQTSAVPPPPVQPTAVCDRPVYATDQLVCGDEQLRTVDARLGELYAAADRSGLPDGSQLFESASEWFRRRSLCAFKFSHRSCALAAYRERLAVVQTLITDHGRPLPLNVTCGNAAWRGDRRRVPDSDTLVLEQDGRPIGVAVVEAPDPLWPAFLRADITGRQLTLTPLAGAPLTCSMSTALGGVSDDGLRQRVEAVDALHARAKAAAAAGTIDRSAYAAILGWLRDEELLVHAEAELRTFSDPMTYNYWHRARLKFPTQTQQEIERLNTPAAR